MLAKAGINNDVMEKGDTQVPPFLFALHKDMQKILVGAKIRCLQNRAGKGKAVPPYFIGNGIFIAPKDVA